MPRSPLHARDAALRRMRRLNRWLIAGAVVVTGFLTDVVAQAFPGRTITRAARSSSTPKAQPATSHHRRHHRANHRALTPPAAAPQAPAPVIEPVPGATSAPAAPAPVQSAPAPAPVQSAPAPAPAPVVSGGS